MDNEDSTVISPDFSWASNYPEIFKICTLFNLTELQSPKRYRYKSLQSLIQNGPQCGLVALAMCSKQANKEFVELLYNEARKQNYTNRGEMFSAQYLQELGQLFLNDFNISLYSGNLDSEGIRDCLLNGSLVLVPYDSDKDHSPGLENGRKAHWAVICGAVETDCDFFVIARHGKARNVAAWKLGDLAKSNAQLNEVGTYLKDPDVEFKVPEGGINGPLGLNLKSLILQHKSQ